MLKISDKKNTLEEGKTTFFVNLPESGFLLKEKKRNGLHQKNLFIQKKTIGLQKLKKILLHCDKKNYTFNEKSSVIFSRRTFLLNFFFFSFFEKSFLSFNDIYPNKKKENFNFFFDLLLSSEYKKKEAGSLLQKENQKKRKNFFNRKENSLEAIDKISKSIYSCFLLALMILSGVALSERSSNKISLPESYSPNQINAYFKLRPEKIFTRLSQIFFEIFKLIFGLIKDYIEYPKKENKKTASFKEKSFNEFFFYNKENISNFLKFFGFRRFSFFSTSLVKCRISNIFQIFLFRLDQKEKKFWQIKWDSRAKQVRETIGKLSPAFIKLAQALASRPDLVDERISKELERLQDDMPFFSNEKAFKFIKQELGANPERIFSEISEEPVAAASLGQVYKATLDGIQVAIKVQRPGLLDLIALDIFIIRFFASLAQNIFNFRTDLVSIIDEYGERLFEELDYRKESSNMIKFRSLYGYMDMIYIPRVFLEYSSKHVLVIEWVQGERLVKNSAKTMQDDVSLIEIGVRCSLVQLLETGFLHCDPHGGNLIKTKDGRLAYLDFGLVSEIPETVRYSLISAILNLINREYESLAKDFNGMALIRSDDLDKELVKISKAFFETFDKSLSNFDKFTFQDISEKIFRLTVNFPFILPPYFLNNLRAIATLEGLALSADPDFKIADVIYPYIINKLLTNSAPQFQAALEDFLIDTETNKPNWNRLEALLQDPEWTETFSDQSVNLSDTLLNFIISPTGKFLRNLILKAFLENSIQRTFILYNIIKKNIFFKISKMNKKNDDQEKSFFHFQTSKKKDFFVPNFRGSKVYNLNILFLLIKTCIFSTLIVILEFFLKFFMFFFEFLFQKIQSLLFLPIKITKN